jgi:glycine/D-amino acid oxidase-like deaminating enzyme
LIIGGGYAGASAAYHLFPEEQQGTPPKVVLLEARELCSGATGRNGSCPNINKRRVSPVTNNLSTLWVGGHLRPDLYSATAIYTERYGLEAAVEVVRFEIAHMKELEELVRKDKIDCDLTFTRSFDIYLDADQLAAAKSFYDFLVDQGLDFIDDVKYLSQEEAQGVSALARDNTAYFLTDILF